MGNVELFELCETNPKTQCTECLLCWSEGIVYCTCVHLLRESAGSRGIFRWTVDFLSIPNYVIKMWRQKNKEIILLPTIWEEDAEKRGFEGIHDRFLKDETLRESELEHDRTEEVCVQMVEITLKVFSYHMTQGEFFRYRKNWWISLDNLEKQNRGEVVLTATKRCPHWTVYTKNLENNNSGQCHSGNIKNGTNHRVLPPVGGNGAIPGGAFYYLIESPQMSLRAKRHDRSGKPVVCRLWIKPQTCDFQDFLFCCNNFVYSWQRSAATDGVCKDNTSHVYFLTTKAVWASTRNSRTEVKKFGALTISELMQNNKSNHMQNDLKHVETHEYIGQRLVNTGLNHSWVCLFVVSLPSC